MTPGLAARPDAPGRPHEHAPVQRVAAGRQSERALDPPHVTYMVLVRLRRDFPGWTVAYHYGERWSADWADSKTLITIWAEGSSGPDLLRERMAHHSSGSCDVRPRADRRACS